MARSLQEIKQEILDQKAQQPELAGLNSTSSKAHWMLWVNIVAFVLWIQDKLWDIHREEVREIAQRAVPGTVRWYQFIATQFQSGYELEWNEDSLQYEYPEIDEEAQIVKRAAVREFGGVVQIKFAKLDGGSPVPLDAAEKAAFNSYMRKIKFAGTFLQEISEPGDLLKITMDIYYDPLSFLFTVRQNVEAAITNYVADLPFDSELRLSKLVDQIQLVEGVVDISDVQAEAKHGSLSYQPIDVSYVAFAGHMQIDPANPLSLSLRFIASPQY